MVITELSNFSGWEQIKILSVLFLVIYVLSVATQAFIGTTKISNKLDEIIKLLRK